MTQERQERFMAWVMDLEQRLAYYIIENEGKIILAEPETALAVIPKTRVDVEPCKRGDMVGWCVKVNGEPAHYFFGATAQARASRRAGAILNGEI